MAVNRYQNHIVIFLEDQPYREIVNGVVLSSGINSSLIDIKNPSGGWANVFKELENNLSLLKRYKDCHILLLIDFDDKALESQNKYHQRFEKLKEIVPDEFADRVFILGVNHKESESLKRYFKKSNFEDIGKILVENCPSREAWNNAHLDCNLDEIQRMERLGIYSWLFR